MKTGTLSSVSLLASALAGATLCWPSSSAAYVYRQYPAVACHEQHTVGQAPLPGASGLGFWGGMITNDVLYVAGVGGTSTPVECPIVEDSSFTKGGTSIGVTVDQPPGCWGSNFVHCKVFDSAVGSSCSAEQGISGNGTVTGTRSSSLGVKWSDGADYGYLYVGIGKRSNATASPCALKGYYMLK